MVDTFTRPHISERNNSGEFFVFNLCFTSWSNTPLGGDLDQRLSGCEDTPLGGDSERLSLTDIYSYYLPTMCTNFVPCSLHSRCEALMR
jgi:hypothetical protein